MSLRFLEAYERHLQSRHLVPSSVKRNINFLKWFYSWLGETDIREVRLQHIERYRERLARQKKRTGEPIQLNHQNKQIHTIAAYFRFLHEQGKILVNPLIDLPPIKKERVLPQGIISKETVFKIIEQPNLLNPIGFRDKTILILLFSSGLRGGELCKLTIYDVDFNEMTVRIREPKNKRERIVPMGKVAGSFVKEYLEKVRPILAKKALSYGASRVDSRNDASRLFLSKEGHALIPTVLYTLIQTYKKKAGIYEKVGTHSFRHACAVEMLRSGNCSIRHLQELLGHSSIETTTIYTRLVPMDLKKVHERTAPSERSKKIEKPDFKYRTWRDEREWS